MLHGHRTIISTSTIEQQHSNQHNNSHYSPSRQQTVNYKSVGIPTGGHPLPFRQSSRERLPLSLKNTVPFHHRPHWMQIQIQTSSACSKWCAVGPAGIQRGSSEQPTVHESARVDAVLYSVHQRGSADTAPQRVPGTCTLSTLWCAQCQTRSAATTTTYTAP